MKPRDDGEPVTLFEPLLVSENAPQRAELNDLALELAARAAALHSRLPGSIAVALAGLIRSMNCYYSNLIEGHNTHPIDIERALKNDYSQDPEKRDLQLEARAHIAVQEWIDAGGLPAAPTAPQAICEIHRRFCSLLPQDLLYVTLPDGGETVAVVPGALRQHYVEIGRHVAISPGAVPRFLERLHQTYDRSGRLNAILSSAWAHHRLLWVHPFLDGNGRVARLMSHAMLCRSLETGSLWSVARGLARNESTYKAHLAACDAPRRGNRDGRGNLSEAALANFTEFFLHTCIDQITFMEELMQPERLRDRILIWAEEEIRGGRLPARSDAILRTLLYQGELPRGQVTEILDTSERTARRVTAALLQSGAVQSASSRAPLHLAFPTRLAGRWMPGLFPER